MHLEFVRSGGVAGLRLRAALETEDLTPAEAAGVEALAGVAPGPDTGGRDLFSYRFVVTDGAQRHEYAFSEADAPDVLRPLLERLTQAAHQ